MVLKAAGGAVGAAGCTSHTAAQKAAADQGVMRVAISAADARAAVAHDLLHSMVSARIVRMMNQRPGAQPSADWAGSIPLALT
jgi:hypothetical protein